MESCYGTIQCWAYEKDGFENLCKLLWQNSFDKG